MNTWKSLVNVLMLVFIASTVLISGCIQQKGDDGTGQVSGMLKGVGLSPRSTKPDDFTGFFEEAKQAGRVIMWAGSWEELGDVEKGGPKVITELASTYDYIPLVEVTFFTQSTGELASPLNETTMQRYKKYAVTFAEKYKPKYLGFGIEVNVLYEKSPEDFDQFVSFYDEVYEAVKATSPETEVFTVFQLEKMKGLTFWPGEEMNLGKDHWWMIDKFRSDVIAFTTYPGLVYKEPSEIPSDYYNEVRSQTVKPIILTEIGWHSEASPAGWESSETEQVDFITRFFDLTKDLNLEIAIWSFMYDPDTIEPFRSMGLRRNDGSARPAWDAWLEGGD